MKLREKNTNVLHFKIIIFNFNIRVTEHFLKHAVIFNTH